VELDNGTERVRSALDTESIERKNRGYDAHQAAMAAYDPARYIVIFVTTRSQVRLGGILDAARRLVRNPQRRLFAGIALADFLASDNPLFSTCFLDPVGRNSSLIQLRRENRRVKHGSIGVWPARPAFA
jgi:hypothetical protein